MKRVIMSLKRVLRNRFQNQYFVSTANDNGDTYGSVIFAFTKKGAVKNAVRGWCDKKAYIVRLVELDYSTLLL